ncbi:MAG: metal ABC transporter permease [Planctomycetes bacterium]|nr:metal ABC transporter permease [Planctomycetota bacterium]
MPSDTLIPAFDFATHVVRPWTTDIEITLWVLLMGVSIAVGCAILGCFLILRGKALLGDAISHALLAGLAGAFLVSGSRSVTVMLIGAILAGLLTVFLIEVIHRHSRVKEDAAIAVVFSALFALGVVLITRYTEGVDLDAQCVLYGEIETAWLRTGSVKVMAVITGLVILGVILVFKELKITSFDPMTATAIGIPAGLVHYGLMTAVSVTVVAGMEAVGAILVVAMLIAPGATAYLLTDSLKRMLVLAAACGAASAVLGYHLALWLDCSTAGAMALVATGQFMVALLASPSHGIVMMAIHRARLSARIVRENILSAVYHMRAELTGETVALDALANKLRIMPTLLNRSCRRLQRQGWLQRAESGVSLTKLGADLARRTVRAHRLWEAFLVDQMGVAEDHVHPDAEKIEHILGEKLLDRLDDILGHPMLDPHGRSIPRKPELFRVGAETDLSSLREGDKARVKGIVSTADERLTERITTLHLPLGDEIAVEARNDAGDWVISLPDGKRLTVDHEMADAILVEVRQVSVDRV